MPELEISTRQCGIINSMALKYFANMSKEDAAQFKRFRKWYRENSTVNLKEFWAIEDATVRVK